MLTDDKRAFKYLRMVSTLKHFKTIGFSKRNRKLSCSHSETINQPHVAHSPSMLWSPTWLALQDFHAQHQRPLEELSEETQTALRVPWQSSMMGLSPTHRPPGGALQWASHVWDTVCPGNCNWATEHWKGLTWHRMEKNKCLTLLGVFFFENT